MRDARHAGHVPTKTPDVSAIAALKARTCQSSRASAKRGAFCG